MENTQELKVSYPKYDEKVFVPPFIGRVISWEKLDKPFLEYGIYQSYADNSGGELTLYVKNNDIVEIGQGRKYKGKEGITSNWKLVKFEPKPNLYSIAIPEAREFFFKRFKKDEYIIAPSKKEESKKWVSFKGRTVEGIERSWTVDTPNTSISKEIITKDMENWNRATILPINKGYATYWIDEPAKINQKDFESIERVEKFKVRGDKSKEEDQEKLLKEMEFVLGKELKECVQELIAAVGEMIATGKPAPEKIFKISKKLESVNRKKEIFLRRSIEI